MRWLSQLQQKRDAFLRYEDQRLHAQLGTLQYKHP